MARAPRDYKKEYQAYHGTAAQRKRRSQRTVARNKAIKSGKVKRGDGMEIHHVNAPRTGSLEKVKTAVVTRKYNRKLQPKRS